jgi:hypothetical protein
MDALNEVLPAGIGRALLPFLVGLRAQIRALADLECGRLGPRYRRDDS